MSNASSICTFLFSKEIQREIHFLSQISSERVNFKFKEVRLAKKKAFKLKETHLLTSFIYRRSIYLSIYLSITSISLYSNSYMYVCIYLCIYPSIRVTVVSPFKLTHTHTHTHTHTYIYIYIYIFVCVFVYVCVSVCEHLHIFLSIQEYHSLSW